MPVFKKKPGKEPPASPAFTRSSLSLEDFQRFSEFIYKEVGIKLPPAKKTMIEARLQKRIRITGKRDHSQYVDWLFSPEGMKHELINLIDVVTTNTTDFFREPKHFEALANNILPAWFRRVGRSRRLRIWSAGCSTGMEPYTLSMVLSDFAEENDGFLYTVLATDISTQALQTAVRGVYDIDRVQPVPQYMKKKYLMRGKGEKKNLVRVTPELRRLVDFRRLNFMEEFNFRDKMDIIFCRNVVIYFDKPTQDKLFNKFCRQMRMGAHLFIGHSESLAGMDLPLRQIAPTIYVRI